MNIPRISRRILFGFVAPLGVTAALMAPTSVAQAAVPQTSTTVVSQQASITPAAATQTEQVVVTSAKSCSTLRKFNSEGVYLKHKRYATVTGYANCDMTKFKLRLRFAKKYYNKKKYYQTRLTLKNVSTGKQSTDSGYFNKYAVTKVIKGNVHVMSYKARIRVGKHWAKEAGSLFAPFAE